ncbi:DUF4054 domain-containing protein [Pararobbsia alpina]|uniref:DUF4054 domain-containing protein n=1 Tax=Pararobbsia alpina TaxID=621374 RepID=UPI0039A450B3
MTVVAFDPNAFAAEFAAFALVDSSITEGWFALAELFVNNTDASIVTNIAMRTKLLYLVTAHIGFLLTRAAGGNGANAGAVGQMLSAGEGTVNASFAQVQSKNAAYWAQSQYGLMYWQLALPFRTARYVPACRVYR